MKSLLSISLILISIQFNDIINNQSLVRRVPAGVSKTCHTGTAYLSSINITENKAKQKNTC